MPHETSNSAQKANECLFRRDYFAQAVFAFKWGNAIRAQKMFRSHTQPSFDTAMMLNRANLRIFRNSEWNYSCDFTPNWRAPSILDVLGSFWKSFATLPVCTGSISLHEISHKKSPTCFTNHEFRTFCKGSCFTPSPFIAVTRLTVFVSHFWTVTQRTKINRCMRSCEKQPYSESMQFCCSQTELFSTFVFQDEGLEDVQEMIKTGQDRPDRRLRGVAAELVTGCAMFNRLVEEAEGLGIGKTRLDRERHKLCLREIVSCRRLGHANAHQQSCQSNLTHICWIDCKQKTCRLWN